MIPRLSRRGRPLRHPVALALAVLIAAVAVALSMVGVWLAASPPARSRVDPATEPVRVALPRNNAASGRAGLAHVLRLLRRADGPASPVRILFYGQSITEQGWWRQVVETLHRAYPRAVLQIENRAIGGHSSSLLLKTAEADVYPFQPDLVIFQAYGSHHDYESLIRGIREQTTADVIVASDHVTRDAELDEDTRPLRLDLRAWLYRLPKLVSEPTRLANWNAWLAYSFLPALAERHRLQYVDVRDQWKRFLATHRLRAAQLLRDHIHLNESGQQVMAEAVEGYLLPSTGRQRLDDAGARTDDRLVEIDPSSLRRGAGAPIRIAFQGTRVDVVLREPPREGLPVRVDGEPPCRLPDAYRFDRVSGAPGTHWPALLRVQPGVTPLNDEHWTLTVLEADRELRNVRFALSGSQTGFDGEGTSLARFVSMSGRVVIDPEDWDLAYAHAVAGTALAPGFEIRWQSVCRGIDAVPAAAAPGAGPLTLVQGLRNAPHELVLPASAVTSVAALRIHRPLEGRQ